MDIEKWVNSGPEMVVSYFTLFPFLVHVYITQHLLEYMPSSTRHKIVCVMKKEQFERK